MAWELSDEVSPDAAAMGPPAPVAPRAVDVPDVPTGQWALSDQVSPDAAPPWYAHLLAGFGHRMGSIREQQTRLGGQFVDSSPNPDGTLPNFSERHAAATRGAGEALARQDAADKARGLGEGTLGSILYGAGETPEALAAAPLKLGGPLMSAVATGGAQGLYSGLANDRDALMSTLLGGAGGVLGHGVGKLGAKAVNAVTGNFGADAEKAATDALAKSNGVTLSAGDLNPGSIMAWLENKSRWLPGTGVVGLRKSQAQGIGGLTQGIKEDLRAPIVTELGSATPEEIIGRSAREREKAARTNVKALFDAVPDAKIQPDEFAPAVKQLMTEFPNALSEATNTAPQSVIKRISAIMNPKKAELTPNDQELIAYFGGADKLNAGGWQRLEAAAPGIRDRMAGASVDATPEPLSAMDAHWLQSQLGDISRTQEAAGQNNYMVSLVDKARHALLRDMDNVDNATVGDAFRTARDAYKRDVAPFENDPILRKLTSRPDAVDETLFQKLGPDRPGTARALLENLTPEGVAALRFGQFSKAANAASNDKLESGLSVPMLLKRLNLGNEMGDQRASTTIFPPELQARIGDVTDIARAARNAGTWSHEPPTGVQNVGLNMGRALAKLAAGGAAVGTATHDPMLGLALATLPIGFAGGVNAAGRNALFKRLYLAHGESGADPYLQALLAQTLAGKAPSNAPSLLDQLGQ
jgi:hypothetical protein